MEAVTGGTTDTGPDHLTAEPVGSDRAMRAASSLRATGKATGADLITTIAGIGTALAISTVTAIVDVIATVIAVRRSPTIVTGLKSMPGRPGSGIFRFRGLGRSAALTCVSQNLTFS